MSLASSSLRLFLSVTLLSSWGLSTPLDYQDPQTWFQTEDLMCSQNQTDSKSAAAINVVVTPTGTPTYVPTLLPSIGTYDTFPPRTPTEIVPLPITVPTTTTPPTILPSTLTLRPTAEIVAPITTTLRQPTIAPAVIPQDRSPAISSANSVVVLCSAPNGGGLVSAVTGNDRTSAVVETVGTSTTSPVQVRLTPLTQLRRATTQLPTIVIRNRESNQRRVNNNLRNRESCDMCLSYCRETRQICAKPEGTGNDPDNLRGFQSVCHMDCFNVCRKFRYEKVADGRCGRLRDGIRPLGSKKKLTRIELNKAQYEVADGDDTIYVVSNTD